MRRCSTVNSSDAFSDGLHLDFGPFFGHVDSQIHWTVYPSRLGASCSLRRQQEQHLTGLGGDVSWKRDTANANVAVRVDVDTKKMAQHGCSLVVW